MHVITKFLFHPCAMVYWIQTGIKYLPPYSYDKILMSRKIRLLPGSLSPIATLEAIYKLCLRVCASGQLWRKETSLMSLYTHSDTLPVNTTQYISISFSVELMWNSTLFLYSSQTKGLFPYISGWEGRTLLI